MLYSAVKESFLSVQVRSEGASSFDAPHVGGTWTFCPTLRFWVALRTNINRHFSYLQMLGTHNTWTVVSFSTTTVFLTNAFLHILT